MKQIEVELPINSSLVSIPPFSHLCPFLLPLSVVAVFTAFYFCLSPSTAGVSGACTVCSGNRQTWLKSRPGLSLLLWPWAQHGLAERHRGTKAWICQTSVPSCRVHSSASHSFFTAQLASPWGKGAPVLLFTIWYQTLHLTNAPWLPSW